jgi:iron complex outermembrane receptor protein
MVNPRSPPPYDTFGQEQVDAYETGLKTNWRGSMPGYLNFAVFYNDFQDQQLLISFLSSTGNSQASICACGTSKIYGAELDGSISLFKGFRLSGGLGYLHTELVKFNEPALPPGFETAIPGNTVGAPLTQAPKLKGSLTASYSLPLSEEIGQISVAATDSYTDDYLTKTSSHGKIDSFNTVNLNLNWNSIFRSPMDLSLFGTNVTGEEYYTFATDLYDTSLATVSKVQGLPRMYGLRLRYNFGGSAK